MLNEGYILVTSFSWWKGDQKLKKKKSYGIYGIWFLYTKVICQNYSTKSLAQHPYFPKIPTATCSCNLKSYMLIN